MVRLSGWLACSSRGATTRKTSQELIREWSSAMRAAANPGRCWLVRGGGGVGSGGWLEADLMAEGFELCDESPGFPFGVQAVGEEVSAELAVGPAGSQDVPDDDEDRVRDHDNRFLFGGR